MARVVIVEDDDQQEEPIRERLSAEFPSLTVETISTESEFRQRLPELRQFIPDVMIIDIMLRWANPAPNLPPAPPDVVSEGYYRAGLRCVDLLAQDSVLRRVPIILCTILERHEVERENSLPVNATYVRKSADLGLLVRRVGELIRN